MKVRVTKEEFIGQAKYFGLYPVHPSWSPNQMPEFLELEVEVVERTESYGVSTDDNGKPVLGQWPVEGKEKCQCHLGGGYCSTIYHCSCDCHKKVAEDTHCHGENDQLKDHEKHCSGCIEEKKSLPQLPEEHCENCRCDKRLCDYGNDHCELANCMCHEKEKDEWPISPEEIALVKALNCYFKARDGHKEV